MNLFKKLFSGWKNKNLIQDDSMLGGEQYAWEDTLKQSDKMDLRDQEQREKYVKNVLEQMHEASRLLDELSNEYNLVTSYLTDMEEIEALPETQRESLTDIAKRIIQLDVQRDQFQGSPGYLTEDEYHKVERLESEIEEGIQKLQEAEEYQKVIKRDLKKLDVERQACKYRREDAYRGIANLKGVGIIGMVSIVICIIMLLILQFGFQLDTKIGYLIVTFVTALLLTILYTKLSDANRDIVKIGKSINKLILLQNKVKIRLVNNTNLLDYLYLKYEISSAADLEDLYNRYQQEKTEREKYEQAVTDLDYYQKELIRILRQIRIRDPYIWTHQTEALVSHNEMVEIRHGLITRRQKLRDRIDYNRDIATSAQQKLKELIEAYPAFAKNILKFIDLYKDV